VLPLLPIGLVALAWLLLSSKSQAPAPSSTPSAPSSDAEPPFVSGYTPNAAQSFVSDYASIPAPLSAASSAAAAPVSGGLTEDALTALVAGPYPYPQRRNVR
jgi:hypothetical protein